MKNYTEAERDSISRYALAAAARFARDNGRSDHRLITHPEMLSAAGLIVARWFADVNFRPYNPAKKTRVCHWVAVIVVWELKSWIRIVTGTKRTRLHSRYVEREFPVDFTEVRHPESPECVVGALAIKDEVARVKRAATAKQWAVMRQFLLGHSWRGASLAAGLTETAYYDHLNNLKRKLSTTKEIS